MLCPSILESINWPQNWGKNKNISPINVGEDVRKDCEDDNDEDHHSDETWQNTLDILDYSDQPTGAPVAGVLLYFGDYDVKLLLLIYFPVKWD